MSAAQPVIDSELHPLVPSLEALFPYLDETWRHRLGESEFSLPPSSPHPGVELEGSAPAAGWEPEAVAAELPPSLTCALLVPSHAMATAAWLNPTMSQVFASAVNDYLLDRWLPVDRRMRLAIAVAPHDGASAAAEIRRLGERPEVAAVCLPLQATSMGQRSYHPIYEAAHDLGLPVVVHPGGAEGMAVGPARLGGVGPRTPEESFTLLPQVAMSNVASLVYDGVFQRFPRLRVCFAGFGFAWLPPLLWRADAEWRGLRVETPWLTEPPSHYIAEHIRVVADAASELSPGAQRVVEMLPASLLMYGSDRPFGNDEGAQLLQGLPDELRSRVGHRNAAETLRLDGVVAATGS